MSTPDPYAPLRRDERQRLERFAAAFEEVDPIDYEVLAGFSAAEGDLDAAREVVLRAVGSPARRAAVRAAEARFVDAADRAMARRMPIPQMLIGVGTVVPRVDDRVRLLRSLERAVAAVIVWPELTDSEQAALAGPWAATIERALAED